VGRAPDLTGERKEGDMEKVLGMPTTSLVIAAVAGARPRR
jgi:hypothetical protein